MINKKNIKEHYKKRMLEIREQDIVKEQIVLLGDCVIESIDVREHFNGLTVYNNGISGDTTRLLQETLYKRAIKYKPSKLFISIGSNDIGFDNRDVKSIYNHIVEIVEEVQKRSKETEIHIVSVIPVNATVAEYINREYVDSRDNFDINMLNFYLRNFSRKSKINFIDASKALMNNYDTLNLKYTFDGFHLNDDGLRIITKMIKKHVY
jgi:lysophospholipase L1-like esterase